MKKLYISNIDRLIENDTIDNETKSILRIFNDAYRDWPVPFFLFDEFEEDIRKFLSKIPDEKNIENALKKINYSKHAWYAESLSELLEVFKFYEKGITLNRIIEDLYTRLYFLEQNTIESINNNITNILLVDVLNILPSDIECLIQAPSLKNEFIESIWIVSDSYYFTIQLIESIRDKFITQIIDYKISDYFHNIEIRYNDKLLFEGYDGIEYGCLSKDIIIPNWFNERYILNEDCIISNEW